MSAAPKFTYYAQMFGHIVTALPNGDISINAKIVEGQALAAMIAQANAAADLYAAMDVIANAGTVGGVSAGERKGIARVAVIARAALAKVSA